MDAFSAVCGRRNAIGRRAGYGFRFGIADVEFGGVDAEMRRRPPEAAADMRTVKEPDDRQPAAELAAAGASPASV